MSDYQDKKLVRLDFLVDERVTDLVQGLQIRDEDKQHAIVDMCLKIGTLDRIHVMPDYQPQDEDNPQVELEGPWPGQPVHAATLLAEVTYKHAAHYGFFSAPGVRLCQHCKGFWTMKPGEGYAVVRSWPGYNTMIIRSLNDVHLKKDWTRD